MCNQSRLTNELASFPLFLTVKCSVQVSKVVSLATSISDKLYTFCPTQGFLVVCVCAFLLGFLNAKFMPRFIKVTRLIGKNKLQIWFFFGGNLEQLQHQQQHSNNNSNSKKATKQTRCCGWCCDWGDRTELCWIGLCWSWSWSCSQERRLHHRAAMGWRTITINLGCNLLKIWCQFALFVVRWEINRNWSGIAAAQQAGRERE